MVIIKTCTKCGRELEDDWIYCPHHKCGFIEGLERLIQIAIKECGQCPGKVQCPYWQGER